MRKIFLGLLSFFLCYCSQLGFAEINRQPTPLTGALFNLSYIGNSLTISTNIPGWLYQFAGIKSLTAGFSFLNCSSANGFCLFSVSDSLSANITLRGPATQPQFKLCLNGLGNTFSCENFVMGDRFSYIVRLVPNGVDLCPINSANDQFGSCINAIDTGLPEGSRYIAINKAGTLAYITSMASQIVVRCVINTDGTLGACVNTNPENTWSNPDGIFLNKDDSIAYVANSPYIYRCPVNTDGSFGTCVALDGNGTFDRPIQITLNNAGAMAYVTNFGNNSNPGTTVSRCPINTDGTFGTCVALDGNGTFDAPLGIVLNSTGTIAYVANFGNNSNPGTTVSRCPINKDGTFGTCVALDGNGTFFTPANIALNTLGTMVYVTNFLRNTVSICPVNTDGSFGTCITKPVSELPLGIALF